jgi:hypothetical protein
MIELQEVVCVSMDWIDVAQDRNRGQYVHKRTKHLLL